MLPRLYTKLRHGKTEMNEYSFAKIRSFRKKSTNDECLHFHGSMFVAKTNKVHGAYQLTLTMTHVHALDRLLLLSSLVFGLLFLEMLCTFGCVTRVCVCGELVCPFVLDADTSTKAIFATRSTSKEAAACAPA